MTSKVPPHEWAADHAAAAQAAAWEMLGLTGLEVVSAPRRHTDVHRIPGQGVVLKAEDFYLKTVVRRTAAQRGSTGESVDRHLMFVLVDENGRMLPVMQHLATIGDATELQRALRLRSVHKT